MIRKYFLNDEPIVNCLNVRPQLLQLKKLVLYSAVIASSLHVNSSFAQTSSIPALAAASVEVAAIDEVIVFGRGESLIGKAGAAS